MSRLKQGLLLTLAISTVAPLQMAQARDWLGTAINTVTRVRQAAGALGGSGNGGNYSPPPAPVQTIIVAPAPAPTPAPTPTPTPTPQPTPAPTPPPGGLVGSGYGTSNYYHAPRHGYSTGQPNQYQTQYQTVVQVTRPQPRNVPRVGRVLTRIDHQSPVQPIIHAPQPVQPMPVPKFDDVPGKTAKKDSTPTPSPAVATTPIKFDTGWVNKALAWIKI